MKVLKEGKKLKVVLECAVCGCEFEESLKNCTIDYYVVSYRAKCDCPCCGKECWSYDSDFVEVEDDGT